MTQIRKLLNRREFLQQSGLLGAGAAITAAQAKANLAKSLLGMGDAAVPAALPGLDPRTFLPKALNEGFTLPDGSYVLSNGKLPYLRYSDASTADLSKSQKDLLVKLLQEARDAMPKAPADVVSQYNTLTKNWHQFVTDHANEVKIPGGISTPKYALKAGESVPAGHYDSTYFDSNTSTNGHTFPEEFTESDFYNGSLSTPPSRLGNADVRKLNQIKGFEEKEWIEPPSNQIEGFEREWASTHRSIADMQRTKAKEAGDPEADQAHRKELYDLGLAGTGRNDQPPSALQDTGEITGNVGLPGESSPDSGARIRKLLAAGGVTAAGVGLSTQDAKAAQNGKLIRAFHGSPHPFQKFDSRKIGTGEGAQSFGHGLYFAENEGVAQHYKKLLTHDQRLNYDQMQADLQAEKVDAAYALQKVEIEYYNALASTDITGKSRGSIQEEFALKLALAKQDVNYAHLQTLLGPPKPQGHMYEVDLDVDPNALIRGDVPFDLQHPDVKDALQELGYRRTHGRGDRTGLHSYFNVVNKAKPAFLRGAIQRNQDTVEQLAKDSVTSNLVSMGIPGIEFLDGGSRRRRYGTSNYVMFPGTEDSINIIRKYAVPALVTAAAGGAAAQAQGSTGDPTAFGEPLPEGLIERGNINLYRPSIPNPEGGDSTVYSASFNFGGEEVLLPLADEGRILTEEQAIKEYQRTGKHLGKFSTTKAADAYAGQLHDEYERGDYKIPSPPEQESPQQPSEPVVGAPLIRYLQQEASQNAVHQQRPTENDYNLDDHLNKPTPEGTISGTGLKEFIANANEKNASSPQIDYAHAVDSAMREPVYEDGASIGDRVRRQIYADMAGKQAQMPHDSANYAEEQQKIEAHAADVTNKVAGILAGTLRTNDEGLKSIANNIRAQLKDLSPGGKNASLGHRTQSEANQAQKEYGANAIHTFTPEGAKNHKALAISNLLDAKDNSQSGFLRGIETAAKTVGGFTQPLWHLVKEGSLPRDTGGTWGSLGKDPLESAAQRWADYKGSDGTKAYDEAGKPYFNEYDPTTAIGLGETMQGNQAFPLARFYQNVASPMYDVAQNLTMPNYYQDAKSLRALHTTTPIIPDGVDPKAVKGHLDTFDNATKKLVGYNSANLGRKFADFGNALVGPNTFKRSYLSPIANMALDLPPEIFGDPLNLAVSAAIPPVAGVMSMIKAAPLGFKAAKAAGLNSLGRATLKSPFMIKDDLLGEAATGPAIMAGATGIEGLFTPEKTNALMGDADPNAPGYDERLNEAAIAERERLQGSAAAYGKLVPLPKKPQTRGSVYPYIER